MTTPREIDGFCTDCGNWTDLRGPIGDRRCRCGSGRVAVPPAGFRILGPDEVDPVTVEKCAEVADQIAPKSMEWNSYAAWVQRVANAIRTLGRKA